MGTPKAGIGVGEWVSGRHTDDAIPSRIASVDGPREEILQGLITLNGKMGTTNCTDHTNWKRVTEDPSFTKRVNDKNLATLSLSVCICVHLTKYLNQPVRLCALRFHCGSIFSLSLETANERE